MKSRNIVIFALAGVLLIVSFLLPGAVLAIRDSAVESRAEYVTMDEVELSLVSSLTAEEKLKIAGDSAATSISLDSGVEMDRDEAAEAAMVTMGFDSDWYVREISPMLLVGEDGRSFVLWQADLSSYYASATLLLDDETRALLGFSLLSEEGADKAPPVSYYVYADIDAPDPEDYIELSEFVLDPAGLVPETVMRSDSGAVVTVEGSDLIIRITLTGENGSAIRLNMG